VLEAVAHAHANQIVHRDLKPPNILVRDDGRPKLLDFGIAKLLHDEGQRGSTTLTVDGGLPLTPAYAAPEQLIGAAITAATDIYALGVLLFVLLTGRLPAGDPLQSRAELLKAILQSEPPRPSEVVANNTKIGTANAARRGLTPDKLSRVLRGDLDTIVATALKEDPSERYASVAGMADDLKRYLKNEPIRARPDTLTYRIAKFTRRNRNRVFVALIVTAALFGAAVAARNLPRNAAPLTQYKQRRLTANSRDLPVVNAAISPDGKYLGYGDQRGIYLQTLESGETQDVPLPVGSQPGIGCWEFAAWYPDSVRFVAALDVPGQPVSLWQVSLPAKSIRKLADVDDFAGMIQISSDGSAITFARLRSSLGAREIWVMGSEGEEAHRILNADKQSSFRGVSWSPAGNRIAYSTARRQTNTTRVSVQSCDVTGANIVPTLQEDKLNAMIWLPSGRFVYSRVEARGAAESDNLWELRVDDDGRALGPAHRLTDWSGFSVYRFNATRDGKQLSFLKGNEHTSVFVGDLAAGGNRLVNARRLTTDENINIPLAWTPDSRDVIFSAQRASTRTVYRQALDRADTPQLIPSAPDMNFYLARRSPDPGWLLLEGEHKGASKLGLYRVGAKGGVPQLVFELDGFSHYWCTNQTANLCVIGRTVPDRNELVISSFDPVGGTQHEMTRIPLLPGSDARIDYSWQLAPDGSRIALLKRHGNQVQMFSLNGELREIVAVRGYRDLIDLNWASDSRSLFISTLTSNGAVLLHVDLNGHAQPIWSQPQVSWIWGFPSPDERHVAILGTSSEANAWMISDF
jgi:Tol biopolymer transport system component